MARDQLAWPVDQAMLRRGRSHDELGNDRWQQGRAQPKPLALDDRRDLPLVFSSERFGIKGFGRAQLHQ